MNSATPFQVLELHPRQPHSCFRCEHNHGEITISGHVVCMHRGRRHIKAQAEFGCVYWLRATGSDDDE